MLIDTRDISLSASTRRKPTAHDSHQWLRIIPPGITDPQVRFDEPIIGLLSEFIENAFGTLALAGIDCLSYPSRNHQSYLIRPRPNGKIDPVTAGKWLSGQADLSELTNKDIAPPVAGLAKRAEADLIGRIGLEVVTLDTTPLGKTPGITTRFVSPTASPKVSVEPDLSGSFSQYLTTLNQEGIPHFARTTIGPTAADIYAVEQQVGLFGTANRCLYAGDHAALLEDHEATRMAAESHLESLSSNLGVFADSPLDVRSPSQPPWATHRSVLTSHRTDTTLTDAARKTVTSGLEYKRLFGRLTDTAPLRDAYDRLGVSPTLEIPPALLPQFLGLVPNYGGGRWSTQTPSRAAPVVTRLATVRDASGTDHETLAPSRSESRPPAAGHTAATSIGTTELGETAIRRLTEYGDDISGETQLQVPGEVVTRETPTGHTEPVIIGPNRTLSAGDLIAAADNRCGDTETGLTVITDTEDIAYTICGLLREPFSEVSGSWTTLYMRSNRYWVGPKGGVALIKRNAEAHWQINPDGQLRLLVDGEPAATGETTQTVRPTANDPTVFWGVDEPPHYSVFDAEKQLYETFQTRSELAERYRPVDLPAIPSRPSYLGTTSVFYVDGTQLVGVEPTSQIDSTDRQWHTEELALFLRRFSCETSAGRLAADTVERVFREYLYPQTPRRLPSAAEVKRSLRELQPTFEPDIIAPKMDDRQDPDIRYRAWRYPFGESVGPFESSDPTTAGQQLACRLADEFTDS